MNRFLKSFFYPKGLIGGMIVLCLLTAAGMVAVLMAQQPQDKPDYDVRVTSFWPSEYLPVRQATSIIVKFSRDMMPDDSLNLLTADIPLELNPPISGLARWIDNDKLEFMPDSMFAPSTEYKINIKSDRTYLYGNRINEPQIFTFRTPTLIVQSVNTEIVNVPEPKFYDQLIIHLIFNYKVDPQTLVEHLYSNLKGPNGPIDFEIKDTSPAAELTLVSTPFKPQEVNGEFDFTVTKDLQCVGGQIPLQADFKQKIRIPKPVPLVINQVTAEAAGQYGRIVIYLSQSTSLSEAGDFISISPETDFTINQNWDRIELNGNFKPREAYTVNIRAGLRALNGQSLDRDFSSKVETGDLYPLIRFIDDGQYMSKKSRQILAIETTNIDELSIEVEQIFVNNIVYYLGDYGRDISRVGRRIFFKEFKLPESKNIPLVSTFDIGDIVGDSLRGIYKVSVREKTQRWTYAEKQVMISDLGIMSRLSDNYLMVWVNSLSSITPVSKADVALISRNNQVLLSGKTDSRGIVVFENIAEKMAGFEPYLITVGKDNDLSYLNFNECMIYTSDFDVDGRQYLTKGYEAFLYSDRGVYRPGETVHLVSVLRGVNNTVPQEFPYIVSIKDPQGRSFNDYKLTTKDQAISGLDIDLPSFAKTGGYRVEAKIGEDVIGTYNFQVEEFMPDRIKATLTTDKDSYISGDEVRISVNGVFLFGPPCAGNNVNGHITIESDYFSPRQWSGYSFSNSDIDFAAIQVDLPSDSLDDAGNHIYNYRISSNLKPPSSLKMMISGTVQEEGGRAVSAYKSVKVNPYMKYLGIKTGNEGYAKIGETSSFNIVAVDSDGNLTAIDSAWVKFYHIIYQNIVRRDQHGIFRYVSEPKDQIVDSTFVSISNSPAIATFTPQQYGEYKAKVVSNRTSHTAVLNFYAAGWGYSSWSMANPDKIELQLDKKTYKVGDKAKLLVKAPFEGKLLLTIEKEKILEFKTIDMDSNTAKIELPIKSDYGPNVYIYATLIKSTTSLERFSPARAFGIAPIMVDNSNAKLAIQIESPTVIKPQQKLDIRIKTNMKKGTKLTVAAVDMGILMLTDFRTPDPFDFFYGKKRPALRPYDIYSLIFPDISESESKLSPAGSAAYEAARKRHLNPISAKRVKPVALWSGIIQTDTAGNAMVSFDVPQFNGKLAIMAVGFNGSKCGSSTEEVTVRDKIVIQESLPRFISPSDRISTPVVIFNNTGKADSFAVAMKIDGPAELVSKETITIFIKDNSKEVAQFIFKANPKPGKVKFEITATNGVEVSMENVELANRPAKPLLTEHGSGTVKEGIPARISMADKWLEGTSQYELKLSSMPAVRLSGSIQYLLAYPYGCIEQTTSRLFPLLYFNDLAKFVQPDIFGTKGQDYFIGEGIMKVSGMQLPSGEFVYWQGDNKANPWASVYSSHFLVEARKAGYGVNDDIYDKMIKNLQKMAKDASLENNQGVLRIYASYVLAKAGKLDKSVINNLKLLNIEQLPVWSRFQLAAAIALTTGVNDALWLIPVEIHPLKYDPQTGEYLDSDIRANAILLDVLSEIAPDNPSVPELIKEISEKLYLGEWYTTQSNSWALMALGKFLKSQEQAAYTGIIMVDGKKYGQFGIEDFKVKDALLANRNIEITITGKGTCYYFWQASGVSIEKAVREFDNRMTVRREYLNIYGNPLDINNVNLGDQVVVRITAEARDKYLENVVINDLLPACFEIDNPRLQTTGRVDITSEPNYYASYTDIRDDRLLLFVNLRPGDKFTYKYALRAVSSGEFMVPPIAGECMYDPTIASAASSGFISVNEGR